MKIVSEIMLRIKQIAEKKKVPLNILAEKIGKTAVALSYYISGERKIKVEELYKIADALEVDPTELIKPSDGYAHWYHESTGEYLGIRKI